LWGYRSKMLAIIWASIKESKDRLWANSRCQTRRFLVDNVTHDSGKFFKLVRLLKKGTGGIS
jgi:hypothetical protein